MNGLEWVLCTDKEEFAEVENDVTTVTHSTTVTTSIISTVSTRTTTTRVSSVSQTDVTISVSNTVQTVFTSTAPAATQTAGTVTLDMTVTETETEGETTVSTTITAGPITLTVTNLIPLTLQQIVNVPSTLTIIGTDFTSTCVPIIVTSTDTIISISTQVITTVITITTGTSSTTSGPCPTGRISSCPCEPGQDGFVLVHNKVPFEEAACACHRIGAGAITLS